MKRITKALSFANVMASVAVFLALGGAAIAANQAAKNSVTSKSIKNESVTGKDVKDDSLTGSDVNEGTLTGVAPTGAAGGDLTGRYPNPVIGPNTVGTNEIANEAVTNADLGEGAVTDIKLANNSVNQNKIVDDSVRSPEIAPESVGVSELADDTVGAGAFKGMNTAVSQAVNVTAGTPQDASVSCPDGFQLVSGGYAWQEDEGNSIITNAPSDSDPNRTWEVRGMVDAGSNNLFAWALCIQP